MEQAARHGISARCAQLESDYPNPTDVPVARTPRNAPARRALHPVRLPHTPRPARHRDVPHVPARHACGEGAEEGRARDRLLGRRSSAPGNLSAISTEAALAAAARAMAFQCSSGQAGVGIFIPVILRAEKLQVSSMTGILVHIDDRVSAEPKVRAEIDKRDIGFFLTQPANSLNANADGWPYITTVMELGVQPFY
ncbi:hypothetical protein DFH11DRAFT_1747311 [Phellopilus nigrolimitatus]|nr:hypothetical protein DFH11DRAFT_1747311 [Phellopilus nigrolimitatus]